MMESRGPVVSLSPAIVGPVPETAEICRRYEGKELSVFEGDGLN
jgi:hypothetical protein